MITADDVTKIAKLAKLRVSDDDAKLYAEELSKILTYIEQLNELELADIQPLIHIHDQNAKSDGDSAANFERSSELLKASSNSEPPFFCVPGVLRKNQEIMES